MAARINLKVVIPLLGAVALGAAVVVAVAFLSLRRTAEFYRQRGDTAAAAGDWRGAEEYYSKAVYKDQANIDLLDLWRGAIERVVPENSIEALTLYQKSASIMKKKTEIRAFEPQYHIDWLTHILTASLPEPSSRDAALLAAETETMLRSRPASDDNPLWEAAYRFRGIAGAYRMREAGLEKSLREQARADLLRCLKHDADSPDADSLAVEALIRWHLYDAADLAGQSKTREALARIDEARTIASAHLASHPADVLILHTLAECHLAYAAYERDLPDISTDAMAQYRRTIAQAEQLALTQDSLAPWIVRRLANNMIWASDDRAASVERAARLVEHALAGTPDHPQLRYDRARFLAMAGKREQAMQAFQSLIDSPNLPVSLLSVQLFSTRPLAVMAQFDMDIERWVRTDPADAQALAEARTQAQNRLNAYRALVSETDENIPYLEGRFALADRQPGLAASRLNHFLTAVGRRSIPTTQRLTALIDLATALQLTDQPGAAYDFLQQANQLTSASHPPILRSLITLDLAGRNLDRAAQTLNRLIEVAPDDPATAQLRNSLAASREHPDPASVTDPVLAAILSAREALAQDKPNEARLLLAAHLPADLSSLPPGDALASALAVLYELARLEHLEGNRDQALLHTQAALSILEKAPLPSPDLLNNWRLLDASIRGASLEPILLSIVDARPGLTPLESHLEKWRLCASYGLSEAAAAHLDAARLLNPTHPAILEHDFQAALERDDLARARSLASEASRTNADLAGGLTYKARLELRTGQTQAALTTLTQATSLKPYDSTPWRLLGATHAQAGNLVAATEALTKSLEREPNHVATLKELARVQLRRAQPQDALVTLRKARLAAPADPAVREAWLELEARHGNAETVLALRRRTFSTDPSDLDNALSLVNLCETLERYDEAGSILDSLDPAPPADRLRLAQARADWHRRQGRINEGRDVLLEFIRAEPAHPNDLMTLALLALTQYYIDSSMPEEAITTAREAISFQDPVRREADRALGEIYLALSRMDEALEAYERALSGGSEIAALSIQLVNLHLVLARRDHASDAKSAAEHRRRAGAVLDAHEKAHGSSIETALLRGELAYQSRDFRAAENAFNEAVARYPQDSRTYAARARFNVARIIEAAEDDRAVRVRADVEQALQLNPSNEAPLMALVDLARHRRDPRTGRPDPDVSGLIEAWRRILDINPRAEDIRSQLVELLYSRREFTQAQVLIEQAIALDPKRGAWHEIQGDLERNLGAPPEQYANHYGLAFEKQPSANRLRKLAEAWLALRTPRAAQVIQLYRQFEAEVGHLPSLRMLLAQAQALAGQGDAAVDTLRGAGAMVLAEADVAQRDALMREWFEALEAVAPAGRYAALVAESFPDSNDPWLEALLGNAMHTAAGKSGAADPAGLRSGGLSRMASARDRIRTMPRGEERTVRLQREVGWMLATAQYAAGSHAEAADSWRWILEVEPAHFATLNNLAYVLARDLNQPAEALPFARRAHESSPTDPTLLDTYGYVLFRNGRLEDAERILRESIDREEQSGTRMHLGEVLAARGEKEAARRELSRARTLAQQQNQTERIRDIDEILRRLDN